MRTEIIVPSVGESVTEATVAAILVPTDSPVAEGAEIIELETDKVNQVLQAPASGRLILTVAVGDKVQVGQTLGYVSMDGGVVAPTAPKAVAPPPPKQVAPPAAQKEEAPTRLDGATRRPMTSLRQTLAKRLVEVKNQTAMLTTFNEVDLGKLMEARSASQERFQKSFGIKLGLMSFFTKAAAKALQAFPEVGAILEGTDLVYMPHVDIAIAVSTDRGLMTPVLRQCEEKTLGQLEQELASLAEKARTHKITLKDLQGGCFTITNGGVFGSMLSTPILNPPQSAILGMHTIMKRPVAVEDQVMIRPMMYLALSYDHRVIDGKEAVQFLIKIRDQLQAPESLIDF